ncbi:YidH family protein [Mucilaginibacter terrenus]|nr:DUF202 domain-containing protein [Mucilaginibacter terrenus]
MSDHLANERTFLAWVRTSIAIMGFGFVVVKFSLFVKQVSIVVTGHPLATSQGHSAFIGTGLVAVGALTTLLGYVRYLRTEKQITSQMVAPQNGLLLLLTIGIIVVSCVLLFYLLPNL